MGNIQDFFLNIAKMVNAYLSDYILIFLLIGVGLFYSIKTRFVQVRCFKEGWNQVFGNFSLKGAKQNGGMSSFQAVATAIAGQVGTGNIVGACGAILIGGPGAIFWMWVIAFFGMATIYAEAVLAQKTRTVDADGTVHGGPVYYITTAFKGGFGKFLAGFFAVSTILALGFMGAMVQSNSIAETGSSAFGIPSWAIGILIALFAALIFVGGLNRLASVTEKIVPLMATLYLAGGLIILICRIKYIPEAFGMIFKYAFAPTAIIGGGIGFALKTAISQGAKRGLFSNEAGMGSTPHAHAMANVDNPHKQGVAAMIGVFIDTFVVLTMTALVVISTLYAGNGMLSNTADKVNLVDSKYKVVESIDIDEFNKKIDSASADLFADSVSADSYQSFKDAKAVMVDENGKYVKVASQKANMAQIAFGSVFGGTLGNIFVAVCLLFFAFSTIISWNLFGKINMEWLFGKKSVIIYSIIAIIFTFLGSLASNDLVWELTDMFNNIMVIPNVIALFALGKLVTGKRSDKGKK